MPAVSALLGSPFAVSGSEWVVLVLLSFVWGFLGYRLAERERRLFGRPPWGLPSLLWAFFWFFSLLLGVILYLIYLATRSAGGRQIRPESPAGVASGTMTARKGADPNPGSNFPAYPRPANSGPDGGGDDSARLPSPPPAPDRLDAGAPSAATPPLPSWYPDPGGRFHFRWWNGSEWTSQVSVDGQHVIDTSPDQRIGPYST